MGRVSPGMRGGLLLISLRSKLRARAIRGAAGGSRVTVISRGARVIVPPRWSRFLVMARYSSGSRR